MPAKKTTQNKSDFIREHASLSAADVIAAGKKAGLKISSSLVYMVRGRTAKSTKTKAKKTSASAAPRALVKTTPARLAARRSVSRQAAPVARPITTSTKAEDLLRAVAAEVGLGRAIELLEAERARVHAVLRG